MSVQELEAGVERLVSEIEGQNDSQIVKNLEQNKSLLQRQLNAIRDPVARLPLEISSDIFLLCLPFESPGKVIAGEAPTLLLSVCNTWSDIALATPSLWTTIVIDFPCLSGFEIVLEKWLQRSGTHPLYISTGGPLDPQLWALIWRHSNRIDCFEILPESQAEDLDFDYRIRDILAGTQPESLRSLRALTIAGSERLAHLRLPILRLLQLSPVLTELALWDLLLQRQDGNEALAEVVLPNLRRLTLGSLDNDYFIYDILDYISAPGLEKFILDCPADSPKILSFLRRSSSPLREIHIEETQDYSRLDQLLPLISTVTRVRLWWMRVQIVEQLFNTLAQNLHVALPNLRSLEVEWTQDSESSESPWNAILRGLSGRRNQLQTVRLSCRSNPFEILPNKVIIALRELAEDGLDLWVGKTYIRENMLFSV